MMAFIRNNTLYLILIESDRPKLKDLYKHVTPCYAAHWEDIGVYLDIELGHLKIIRADHPSDTSSCCKDLWKKWLEIDPDATWEKLFTAIDSAIPSASSSTGTRPADGTYNDWISEKPASTHTTAKPTFHHLTIAVQIN